MKTLDEIIASLPKDRRRAIERGARRMCRRQTTANTPSLRDVLTEERMRLRLRGCEDQQENDISLAWYLWSVRNDPELFAHECWSTPPRQLVHVLFLLRKILRHPEWKLARQFRPSDAKFANRREHVVREMREEKIIPSRHGWVTDLLNHARRYAGLENRRGRTTGR